MIFEDKLWIAQGDDKVCILPRMANRHGLIAGATGTGKTVTLKVLAESFSDIGVPVFLADVKGDLAGMCQPGTDNEGMQKRIEKFGLKDCFSYRAYPSCFWDIFGKSGHPLRTTVSEMGPTLFSRLMGLNETQEGVLSIVYKIADDAGLLLLDFKDLRSMLQHVGDNAAEYTTKYGNITKQSIGAITRGLLALEQQGGDQFFGEPALDIRDWIRTDTSGHGMINILHCAELIQAPQLYATFMLWMLSELFEIMPEVGDCDKPKIVFFFDEAHLLFNDAPKALMQKIEQVVKLIRSKGVGVYFITQSPSDLPDNVLAQLGNRIQHALRAYTPAEQKAVKTAAQTFRENPAFKTEDVITEMGTGEALVSFLDEQGRPSIVQRSFILPPQSRMGPVTDAERTAARAASNMGLKYDTAVDRESAYEFLEKKHQEEEAAEEAEKQKEAEEKAAQEAEKQREKEEKEREREQREKERERKAAHPANRRKSSLEKAADSAMTSIGREIGRNLIRGLMNNLTRRR